jgi:hypothetical protein
MTKRTYTQKNGTIWEWEESNELVKLLKQLHQQQSVPSTGSNDSVV